VPEVGVNYSTCTLRVVRTPNGWSVYRDDQLVYSLLATEARAKATARGLLSLPAGYRLQWVRVSADESKAEVRP
jgi:hypothetical protein